MKAFAAFLNLVVAATLRGRWEEEGWVQAYHFELPDEEGVSKLEALEACYYGGP